MIKSWIVEEVQSLLGVHDNTGSKHLTKFFVGKTFGEECCCFSKRDGFRFKDSSVKSSVLMRRLSLSDCSIGTFLACFEMHCHCKKGLLGSGTSVRAVSTVHSALEAVMFWAAPTEMSEEVAEIANVVLVLCSWLMWGLNVMEPFVVIGFVFDEFVERVVLEDALLVWGNKFPDGVKLFSGKAFSSERGGSFFHKNGGIS